MSNSGSVHPTLTVALLSLAFSWVQPALGREEGALTLLRFIYTFPNIPACVHLADRNHGSQQSTALALDIRGSIRSSLAPFMAKLRTRDIAPDLMHLAAVGTGFNRVNLSTSG